MKRCVHCNKNKKSFEYRKKSRNQDGLDSWCKGCRRESDKKCYYNHVDKNREDGAKRKRHDRELKRNFIFNYLKDHPCVDCGESNPIVLEFDHQRDKSWEIASIGHDSRSLESLQKEIDKCEVRCANCHRIKTAIAQNYYRYRLMCGEIGKHNPEQSDS